MGSKFKELVLKLQWAHVVLAIGLAAGYSYFMLDQSEIEMREQNIQSLQSEIESTKNKIREAEDFEKQFEEKKRRYADLVKELQKIQGALPKQVFLPDLLSDLLREAKQLEIEISSIQPDQSETAHELYNSLGFTIEAKGTFLQFFIFLDRLAHMKRLVDVQKFSLSRDESRPVATLGGEEGAFAGTKLGGGRTIFPGVKVSMRVITYRYRGSGGGGE